MSKDVMAGVAQLEQFDEELYKVLVVFTLAASAAGAAKCAIVCTATVVWGTTFRLNVGGGSCRRFASHTTTMWRCTSYPLWMLECGSDLTERRSGDLRKVGLME